jgi:hypothetical protein
MKCIVCRNLFLFCPTADAYVSQKHAFEAIVYSQMDTGYFNETVAWQKMLRYEALLLFPGKEPKWVNGDPVCYVCYNDSGGVLPRKKRRFGCWLC